LYFRFRNASKLKRHFPAKNIESLTQIKEILDNFEASPVEHVEKAKAVLLNFLKEKPKSDKELVYLLGLAYLKEPYDTVKESSSSPTESALDVLNEIKKLKKQARLLRRKRAQQLLGKNSATSNVAVIKNVSGQKIPVSVGIYYMAWRWLEAAALMGHVSAMVRVGNLCIDQMKENEALAEKNVRTALNWYIRASAVENPSTDAMYN